MDEKPRKKVAIVGSASHWNKAPFHDDSWEIWGLNEMYVMGLPRVTRWFEIHDINKPNPNVPDHRKRLADFTSEKKIPVYMWQHYDDIPQSLPYPKDEIVNHFGRYFTNGISWMIAMAIYEGFDVIGIWGVDMAVDTEWEKQRPSCEYFIGWALGKGIEVILPPESDLLFSPFLYGFEDEPRDRLYAKHEAREKELTARIAQTEQQINQMQAELFSLRGARDDSRYWKRLRVC